MTDLSWANRYLIDHAYHPTEEFKSDLRDIVEKVRGTERSRDRSEQRLMAAFENVVLEYALADALDLELLSYRRHAADLRDNELGVRIDVKRQRGQYFDRLPEHFSSLWDNVDNIDLIVTGDYKLIDGVFQCRFKQAFTCSSLFNLSASAGDTWSPSGLLRLSVHDDPPLRKRTNNVHYYDHRAAEAKGVGVHRRGAHLCA